MAKSRCVLCEKELGFFNQRKIYFCSSEQAACDACAEQYKNAEGDARKALDERILASPHLDDRAYIEEYLSRQEALRQRAEAKKQAQTKHCPNCSALMELKLENFSIGADGGGGLVTLLAAQYDVDLYACPQCGKVELYTTGFIPGMPEEEELSVTCPVCGREHHPAVGCPSCALRGGSAGRIHRSEGKSSEKPPWEK